MSANLADFEAEMPLTGGSFKATWRLVGGQLYPNYLRLPIWQTFPFPTQYQHTYYLLELEYYLNNEAKALQFPKQGR